MKEHKELTPEQQKEFNRALFHQHIEDYGKDADIAEYFYRLGLESKCK